MTTTICYELKDLFIGEFGMLLFGVLIGMIIGLYFCYLNELAFKYNKGADK